MFFQTHQTAPKNDLELSGFTKLSRLDTLDSGEELGQMEFEYIPIKTHR